jgi:ribosomal protein S18 acetylase RimI-like enzyme
MNCANKCVPEVNGLRIERAASVTEEVYAAFQRLIPQLSRAKPPSREYLERLVAFPGSILLIARHPAEGSIVGSAMLALVYAPTGIHARLEDVVVDESLRGLGIGEALTREVIRLAREAEARYIALTCNPRREAANRLYLRLGFTRWETNLYWMGLEEQ